MPIKVLYIHHCGVFGGASRSLMELITAFPKHEIEPIILSQKGKTADYFKKSGITTYEIKGLSQFDNTRFGYYRSQRWLILLREIYYLPFSILKLWSIHKKHKDIELIHLNDFTYLPIFILCHFIFKKPIVIHARSLQRKAERSLRSRIIEKIYLKLKVKAIIAIDETVQSYISPKLPISVIHNGFKIDSIISQLDIDKHNIILNRTNKLIVGYIGNLLYLKGSKEFVKAAKLCKDKNLDVKFIIVGYEKSNNKTTLIQKILRYTKITQNSTEEILKFIETFELKEMIELYGFTTNISMFYNHFDVLCFPSHLNAAGRPVFEAAFHKKPSIVAVSNPTDDTIIHKTTGLCIDEKSPEAIVEAIEYFYFNPDEIRKMGEEAFNLVSKNYDIDKNALTVLKLYKNILEEENNVQK